MVFIYKVHLLKLATTVNIQGQVFGQAGKSRQPAPVVIASTTYSMDKWNPIDMVMLAKCIMTERMMINKFHKVFKTQVT